MLTTPATRPLEPGELGDALALLAREPLAGAFVAARVIESGLDPRLLGGELWGWYHRGRLRSLCFSGANLVPLHAGPAALRAFAERALAEGRRCTSIVGPAPATAALWAHLEPHWGPARAVRAHQPLMATSAPPPPGITPDPLVRPMRKDEMDLVLPAAVAMFTEEVGVSPLSAEDGGLAYQSRVAETVGTGRCFARVEDGRIVFKAEIGAVTPHTCQLTGVWTAPRPPPHRARRRGPRHRRPARPRHLGPRRQPLRQRLQRPRPRPLPPPRLHHRGRTDERAVLTGAR